MSKFQVWDEWECFGTYTSAEEASRRAEQVADDYKHSATKHDIEQRRRYHNTVDVVALDEDGELGDTVDCYDYF